MKPITADDPLSRSADIVDDNVARLKGLFPEAFTEGRIDFDVLKQLLGGVIEEREEKYGLNWHGKRRARQLALTPSTGTLRPCPEDSVDWDTTQNLVIEGDNLEVLKLLQKSYSGKVKLIYIDPPYNTGKDFVYPDDFRDCIGNYQKLTGQVDANGHKLSSNMESSGRFHTDWLNMMYPRLKLARNLMQEDGALFVSIADHEVHNLRSLMDEIFGPENFVAVVIWQKVYAPKSSAKHFSEDHDYIVVYARNGDTWRPYLLDRTEEQNAIYQNLDNDPRGPWRPNNLAARNYYSKGTYSIKCPSGRLVEGPPSGSYWRVSEEKFHEMDRDNRIWWGIDGNNVPAPKIFLSEVKDGRVPQTIWSYKEVGHNQEAKKEVIDLLPVEGEGLAFGTPKPVRLLSRIIDLGLQQDNEIFLDFFAGSGTGGHAVMAKNAADNGARRYILVQLPETLDLYNKDQKAAASFCDQLTKPRNIAELTKERLRRAANKIKTENPMFAGDTGFRVFKLDSSNIRTWEPDRADMERTLESASVHLKLDRSENDILYELLLKLGLDLCVPIETKQIAKKAVHSIGGGVLLVCLDKDITRKQVEPLALGIAKWHSDLKPAGESQVVFRDSAFEDDVAKSNLTAILTQHRLTNVRSL